MPFIGSAGHASLGVHRSRANYIRLQLAKYPGLSRHTPILPAFARDSGRAETKKPTGLHTPAVLTRAAPQT
jgi:hypothetical protein